MSLTDFPMIFLRTIVGSGVLVPLKSFKSRKGFIAFNTFHMFCLDQSYSKVQCTPEIFLSLFLQLVLL